MAAQSASDTTITHLSGFRIADLPFMPDTIAAGGGEVKV